MFKKLKSNKPKIRPQQAAVPANPLPAAAAPLNAAGDFSLLKTVIEQGTLADMRQFGAKSPNLFHQRTARQQTVWHLAAKAGDPEKLQFLLSCLAKGDGNNIDAMDDQEKTALHLAVISGSSDCVRLLLQAGASLTIASDSGQTALHYAAQYPHPDMVAQLLRQVPKTERAVLLAQRDGTGKTALHYAAAQETNVELVTLLLDNGANVHLCDNDHNTPLHTASRFGFQHIVVALMAEGAVVAAKNHRGETPYWLALRFGHEALALWLLNYYPRLSSGYEINQIDDIELKQIFCSGDSLLIREQREKATECYQEVLSRAEQRQNPLAVMIAKQKLGLAYLANETLQQVYPELMGEITQLRQAKGKGNTAEMLRQTEVLLAKAVEMQAFAVQVILLREQSGLYLQQQQYLLAAYTANAALALYQQQRPLVHLLVSELNADEKTLYECMAAVELKFLADTVKCEKPLAITALVDYRRTLAEIRQEIQSQLNEETPIPSACMLETLTTSYQKLLHTMITASIETLGTPPCEYAILGFGALARSSLSPYSAIEWGILLKIDNPSNRSYFTTLARLVELALINLGETPYIYGRRDYVEVSATPSGLRLEATGIAPLGRVDKLSWKTIGEFKILGTPQQLAAYQTVTSDMPLEERLRETLQVACLIGGSTKLLDAYKGELGKRLDTRSMWQRLSSAKKNTPQQQTALATLDSLVRMSHAMLSDEPDDEEKEKEKETNSSAELKREDYRLLERFITTLAQFYQLEPCAVWDCLKGLEQQKVLHNSQCVAIKQVLDNLIRLRFRVQLQVGSSADTVSLHAISIETGYCLSPAEREELENFYTIFSALRITIAQLCRQEDALEFSAALQSRLDDSNLKERIHTFLHPCIAMTRLAVEQRHALIEQGEAYFKQMLAVNQQSSEKEEYSAMAIAYKDLIFGKHLGEGAFGAVFQGTYLTTTYAFKRLISYQEEAIGQFKQEVKVMAQFRHPHIATLYGACLESIGEYVLVMEYMPGGSLYDLLERNHDDPNWDKDWALRFRIVSQVVAGLLFLHHEDEGRKKAVIHGDIKSSNVLLNSHYEAKVCDFGTAHIKTKEALEGMGGTFRWMAPEVLQEKSNNNQKTDVYSFGMLLCEIVELAIPFVGLAMPEALQNIVKGERPPITKVAPKPITQLMIRCWAQLPEDRPTMKEASEFLTRPKATKQLRKGGFFTPTSTTAQGTAEIKGSDEKTGEKGMSPTGHGL